MTEIVIFRMPDTEGERHVLANHVLAIDGGFIKETHTVGNDVPADLMALACNLSLALKVSVTYRDLRLAPRPRVRGGGVRLVV